jgi:hypothetical protein
VGGRIGGSSGTITNVADTTLSAAGGNDIARLAVPKPGSGVLLRGGLSLLAGARRRKSQGAK